ncbi:MAG: LLM class flavin-dependent oxidoreductase [Deltaproteobacteria bacterium]|nr:LLM class flavin-dependent oxidoreductase [Deltaproteobacteria bacterium]
MRLPKERASLQLGLFMPNCSNMYAISTYRTEPDEWPYETNKKIALAAEEAGLDFLFPVSRWRGFGGKTNYLGTSLETMTWASALLAVTRKIHVYSTVHIPVFHPLVAAKMGASLDHIGNGRWGINIVSGWSKEEFGMMGIELLPHRERYQRTAAFIEILKGLWTTEPGTFNFDSPWYHIAGGYVMPQPVHKPHPPIANAGISEDAKDLVARLCDVAFIGPPSIEGTIDLTREFKERARQYGRTVRCAGFPFVLWRETEKEAQDECRRIVEHMDKVAVENWARGLNIGSGSFDQFTLEMFTLGAGALPVVGTAEQVALKLKRLHDLGMDGVLMVFLSYHEDTVRFGKEIMPLLRQMGVVAA